MACSRPIILIVDDEPHLTYMLAHKLSGSGFEVVTAANGNQAFAMASQRQPAVIVTDYQMPSLNGFDMCVKLRQQAATADIPVIMLTARGHRLNPDDLKSTNIRALLAKPFSITELLKCVNRVLGPESAADSAPADAETAVSP